MTLLHKALEDSYYRAYAAGGASDAELLRAGFFDDGLVQRVEHHVSWNPCMPTTPLGKVFQGLQQWASGDGEPVVLLSTGAFSPVHDGHLAMMEAAKRCLQDRGFSVIGGFLSPSHDDYVSTKQGGRAALHAEHRIACLEEAVSDSDWLSVCPWEARYAPTALNFTDVVARLQAYLRQQLASETDSGAKLSVVYVFGSDNAWFFRAFDREGMAVCVQRVLGGSGVNHDIRSVEGPGWAEHRWFVAQGGLSGSSSEVRAGESGLVPAAARLRYEQLCAPTSPVQSPVYLVRQDLSYGTSYWPHVPAEACDAFEHALMALLKQALDSEHGDMAVRGLALEAQRRALQEVQAVGGPVLSLDLCLDNPHRLDVSRLFDLGGGQVRSSRLVPRPGRENLADQVRGLPPNQSWLVVDDDTASGTTKQLVSQLLHQAGHAVKGFRFLNEMLPERGSACARMHDIVDARDFLLGARDAGLVVSLSNGLVTRAPYMLPFTSLVFRAKVPAPGQVALSQQLWALNRTWLSEHAPRLRVTDAGCRPLLEHCGFAADEPLWRVAEAFASWLPQQPPTTHPVPLEAWSVRSSRRGSR